MRDKKGNPTIILLAIVAIVGLLYVGGFLGNNSSGSSKKVSDGKRDDVTVSNSSDVLTSSPSEVGMSSMEVAQLQGSETGTAFSEEDFPSSGSDEWAYYPEVFQGEYVNYEYIYPSDTQYITYSDLASMTREQMTLARNEIYARHGYDFQNQNIRDYFLSTSWYHPIAGLNGSAFDESVLNQYESYNRDAIKEYEEAYDLRNLRSDYIFPSDRQYISNSDLALMTREQVSLARNEIYARHGYDFQNQNIRDYFLSKSWYHPIAGRNGSAFDESVFNKYEQKNRDIIKKYEEEYDKRMGR